MESATTSAYIELPSGLASEYRQLRSEIDATEARLHSKNLLYAGEMKTLAGVVGKFLGMVLLSYWGASLASGSPFFSVTLGLIVLGILTMFALMWMLWAGPAYRRGRRAVDTRVRERLNVEYHDWWKRASDVLVSSEGDDVEVVISSNRARVTYADGIERIFRPQGVSEGRVILYSIGIN